MCSDPSLPPSFPSPCQLPPPLSILLFFNPFYPPVISPLLCSVQLPYTGVSIRETETLLIEFFFFFFPSTATVILFLISECHRKSHLWWSAGAWVRVAFVLTVNFLKGAIFSSPSFTFSAFSLLCLLFTLSSLSLSVVFLPPAFFSHIWSRRQKMTLPWSVWE